MPTMRAVSTESSLNDHGTAVATEWELAATRRRLVAYPQALNAVLQTARALRRTPDTVSIRDVTDFGGSN
jgi:proline dehydrogenase